MKGGTNTHHHRPSLDSSLQAHTSSSLLSNVAGTEPRNLMAPALKADVHTLSPHCCWRQGGHSSSSSAQRIAPSLTYYGCCCCGNHGRGLEVRGQPGAARTYTFGGRVLGGVGQGVPLSVGGKGHGITLLGLGHRTITAVRVFLQIHTRRGSDQRLLHDVVGLARQAHRCHGHLLLVLVVAAVLGAL